MAEGHETTFIWLSTFALLMFVTFLVTIFWVRDANTEATLVKGHQDLSAKGYDILRELTISPGNPPDWEGMTLGFQPGLLNTAYEFDVQKTGEFFKIPKEYLKKIYNLQNVDFEILLLDNNRSIIYNFNTTVPDDIFVAQVNRELDDNMILQMFIWNTNNSIEIE